MDILKLQRLRESATLPTRATAGSAGYDLYADLSQPVIINPGKTVAIPTGIAIALPNGNTVAYIYGRSGLGTKHGITLANSVGVIDSDYRGEIFVSLINQSVSPFVIQPQDRIAQMIIAPIYTPTLREVPSLDTTPRGTGGHGSTGR